ncbi:MAG: SMC-Scp complex subunit ScpB [Propionibacteriaceae bacterium]
MSEPHPLTGPVEAMLLMADEPLAAVTLAEALGVPVVEITACLASLATFYDESGRGFELRHVGGGWRYYTRAEHAPLISAWLMEGQHSRLSQAALETLAVIAYLQPISRARISAVRGVNVDGVVRTLTARGLITEHGSDETSGAMLFVTTDLFLEKMGMQDLAELPALAPHLPEAQALEAELAELAVERSAAEAAQEQQPERADNQPATVPTPVVTDNATAEMAEMESPE